MECDLKKMVPERHGKEPLDESTPQKAQHDERNGNSPPADGDDAAVGICVSMSPGKLRDRSPPSRT